VFYNKKVEDSRYRSLNEERPAETRGIKIVTLFFVKVNNFWKTGIGVRQGYRFLFCMWLDSPASGKKIILKGG
jgi:hypothetical protein